MGKSTASSMLQRMRIPIYDSDSSVHKVLSEKGEAVRQVGAVFPEVISNGSVDREALGKLVFKDRKALGVLESIIHPIIRNIQDNFLRCAAANRKRIVVLDIPLLFEVGLDSRCDATIVISAPDFIQEARVMSRPGMTSEKFRGIRERQMSNNEKKELPKNVPEENVYMRAHWTVYLSYFIALIALFLLLNEGLFRV